MKTVRFYYKSTKGYRWMFTGLFMTVIITALTSASFSVIIGKLVDAAFYDGDFGRFFLYFGLYAGLYLINLSFHGGLNYLWARLKITWLTDIRKKLYRHILYMDAKELTRLRSGDVMKRLDGDVECILEFLHKNCFYVAENCIQIFAAMFYLMTVSRMLGAVSLIAAPVTAGCSLYFTGLLQKRHRELEDGRGWLLAWLTEMLGGLEELKLLGAGRRLHGEFEGRIQKLLKQEIRLDYQELGAQRLNDLILLLGKLWVLGCAAMLMQKDNISMGSLVASISYFDSCVRFLRLVNGKLNRAAGNLAGVHRVEEIFALPLEGKGGSITEEGAAETAEEHKIAYEHVCFSYEEKQILTDISFFVKPGEHIALAGKSGEGKSTILQLLYRLYDAQEGRILIEGRPLGELDRTALRARMGIVQQQPVLLRESICYNICLTEEKDVKKQERMWELLEDLGLRQRVEALPLGLCTVLGRDYDVKGLSGGERQRLAIARALWKRPDIILLDEATSALDEGTEEAVHRAILKWAKGATVIYVAHRFAAILWADRILFLQNGRIADTGRHEELLKRCGGYRRLYDSLR